MKTVLFLVPKKRGKGFLKYPTGGQHLTETYQKLNDLLMLADRDVDEIWDDFCMLHINVRYNNFEKEPFATVMVKIHKALKETFPQITSFKKLGWNELFEMVK